MWHTLDNLAKSRFFNPETFKEFALNHRAKYHLDDMDMVGTWDVNALCDDYRASRGPSNILMERNAQIEAFKARVGQYKVE